MAWEVDVVVVDMGSANLTLLPRADKLCCSEREVDETCQV